MKSWSGKKTLNFEVPDSLEVLETKKGKTPSTTTLTIPISIETLTTISELGVNLLYRFDRRDNRVGDKDELQTTLIFLGKEKFLGGTEPEGGRQGTSLEGLKTKGVSLKSRSPAVVLIIKVMPLLTLSCMIFTKRITRQTLREFEVRSSTQDT